MGVRVNSTAEHGVRLVTLVHLIDSGLNNDLLFIAKTASRQALLTIIIVNFVMWDMCNISTGTYFMHVIIPVGPSDNTLMSWSSSSTACVNGRLLKCIVFLHVIHNHNQCHACFGA